MDEIYSWASRLAAESRDRDAILKSYVQPKSLIGISELLDRMRGGLVGIIGLQGVGKSTALMVLDTTEKARGEPHEAILYKWRRQKELFGSLLDGSHEASEEFLQEYGSIVAKILSRTEEDKNPVALDFMLQRKIGKPRTENLRRLTWIRFLRRKSLILIDTPDYSKTDMRTMATDLGDIYWLWNNLARTSASKPNIVVAVQKEMFRDHFFFDKMHKIELQPLLPKQLLDAYRKRFGTTEPFTEDALLTLARMSRGVFRRFLRYITLALKKCETKRQLKKAIDARKVREVITAERLAEDMEIELAGLFPRHSDLRLQAVKLLMHLQESGPTKQSALAKALGMELYALSRLLTRLELNRYVIRKRAGADKIVKLAYAG